MRRSTVIAAIVLVAMLVAGPVLAITGNWVDDFEHPFVAMVVFYDSNGDFIWRCSGSLIDENEALDSRALHRYGRRRRFCPRVLPTGCRRELRSRVGI